jgi:hypothetical protein
MTKEEANKILDERKYGEQFQSIVEVTKALWITGDLRKHVPKDARPSGPIVFSEGFQRVRMAKGERIGEEPLRVL